MQIFIEPLSFFCLILKKRDSYFIKINPECFAFSINYRFHNQVLHRIFLFKQKMPAEEHSQPSQTCKMKLLAKKIFKGSKPLTIFVK